MGLHYISDNIQPVQHKYISASLAISITYTNNWISCQLCIWPFDLWDRHVRCLKRELHVNSRIKCCLKIRDVIERCFTLNFGHCLHPVYQTFFFLVQPYFPWMYYFKNVILIIAVSLKWSETLLQDFCAWPQQVKFTLPGRLFTHLGFHECSCVILSVYSRLWYTCIIVLMIFDQRMTDGYFLPDTYWHIIAVFAIFVTCLLCTNCVNVISFNWLQFKVQRRK